MAQKPTKGPVVAHGKVHRHHGSDWGGNRVANGQVELQYGSRGPARQAAAEDPHAEGVEEEAQEEDQAQEDGDGHVLVLRWARSRLIAAVSKLRRKHCRLHLLKEDVLTPVGKNTICLT